MTGAVATTAPVDVERAARLFGELGAAQLHDAGGRYTRVVTGALRLRTPGRKLAGPAFPVWTDDDMAPGLQALEMAPPAAVVVIADRAPQRRALVGELFTSAAREQGLGGIVVDGAVRDLDAIAHIGLAVWSESVTIETTKARCPATDVPAPVVVQGFPIAPGDWLFGDSDGIVAVHERHVPAVLASAVMLAGRETELRAQLSAGDRLADVTGLADFLAGRGPLKFDV